MTMRYRRCIEMGKIVKFNPDLGMVKKELEIAREDLKSARTSLKTQNFKWATIQAYYAFFHAVRSLLFLKKLREKSHRCLLEALKTLYIDENLVPEEYYEKFSIAMELRESADYRSKYTKRDASRIMNNAASMIDITREIINSKKPFKK